MLPATLPVLGDNVSKGEELGAQGGAGATQEATCPSTSGRWTLGSQTRPLDRIQGSCFPGTSGSHSRWTSPTINRIFSLCPCERTRFQAHTRVWPIHSQRRRRGLWYCASELGQKTVFGGKNVVREGKLSVGCQLFGFLTLLISALGPITGVSSLFGPCHGLSCVPQKDSWKS